MKKKYDYTVHPDNSPQRFKETCNFIERMFPDMVKGRTLVDVDGTTIQIYGEKPEEIIIYDDYDIGAVYIKSDVRISGFSNT